MSRFFQTTVGANQTSTDCYGDIWGPSDIDCHFRHFVEFWGIGGFHFDWALFEAISSQSWCLEHDKMEILQLHRMEDTFGQRSFQERISHVTECPQKVKVWLELRLYFFLHLFTVSKINPYKLKGMDGVLNWSWGFITCSQLLAYGGHDGSTNPWQVDLQVVELEQFWSVEITFESLNPSLESEMCSRRNHDSIVEMVDQHPVLAPLCYVETLVFYQKVMTKQCEKSKKMATLNTHSVTHAG